MKIDSIQVTNLHYEYPTERRFHYAGGVCTARVTSIVQIHSDTGVTGIGAAYSHPGLVHLLIKQQLEPLLRGRDAEDIEGLWDLMYGLTRWYGRKGAAISAIGAVETALWDLRGKALGQPVWKLLGGERASCPAYASGLLWKSNAELAQEAAGHIEAGYRRVKMRLGRDEESDIEAVRAVRNAIGQDADLIVDASMRLDVATARRIGKALEENRVFWFEEPFTPEDLDSFAALRGTIGVPVAAGENEFGVQGFSELISRNAVDIVQPDVSRCGGIGQTFAVGQLAARHGLQVATHTWSDAVAVTANAHVVAALPNGLTVEVDRTGNPFIDALLTEPLRIDNGRLLLSDAPGLGIELNSAMLDKYRMAEPLNMPDGNYSDMVYGAEYLHIPPPYRKAVTNPGA